MKTKIYTLLVLFVGAASWTSAAELNYTKPAVQLNYTKSAAQLTYTKSAPQLSYTKSRKATKKASRSISGRSLTRAQASRSSIIVDDNHFIPSIPDNHFKARPNVIDAYGRTKVRSYGQVWIGPLGGDGVFIGPLGGDGVFTTVLDRMMTGELSNVGKLDEDFNIVLTPGDLASMQEQALKTGDVEMLGGLVGIHSFCQIEMLGLLASDQNLFD